MPTLTIDNIAVTAADGATILDAARAVGIEIPALCAGDGLPPAPSCFVCVVKIAGIDRLLPACATPARDGMQVDTVSAEVLDARKSAIELLLSDHFGDCLAPCALVCPIRPDIHRMLRQIAGRRLAEAIATIKETNAMPAVLGRICPEICEKGCRRRIEDAPVSICRLERFVGDWDLARATPYEAPLSPASGRSVAIVGGGPAGLSAAYFLRRAGHACTVFDARPRPGGMLRYGIPDAGLARDVLDAEIEIVLRTEIALECGVALGRDVTLGSLRSRFDAVVLAIGDTRSSGALDEAVDVGPRGILVHRETMETSLSRVYAAGGAVTPMRHAARAMADGRRAALAIDQRLSGRAVAEYSAGYSVRSGKLDSAELAALMALSSAQSRAAASTAGFTEDEAAAQASRCLQCGCQGASACRLRDWARRCGADAARYRGVRRLPERDDSHPEVLFDSGKCIACGVCVRIAARSGDEIAIGFQGRGFGMRVAPAQPGWLGESLRSAARECALACPTGALTLKGDA